MSNLQPVIDELLKHFTVIKGRNGAIGPPGGRGGPGPRGNQGDKGDKGDKGDDGPANAVTNTTPTIANRVATFTDTSGKVIKDNGVVVLDGSGAMTGLSSVTIGAATVPANALLDLVSTDKGLLLPRLSTTNKNGMGLGGTHEGMMVYDSTLDYLSIWTGTAWRDLGRVETGIRKLGAKFDMTTVNFVRVTDSSLSPTTWEIVVPTHGKYRIWYSVRAGANTVAAAGVVVRLVNGVPGGTLTAVAETESMVVRNPASTTGYETTTFVETMVEVTSGAGNTAFGLEAKVFGSGNASLLSSSTDGLTVIGYQML